MSADAVIHSGRPSPGILERRLILLVDGGVIAAAIFDNSGHSGTDEVSLTFASNQALGDLIESFGKCFVDVKSDSGSVVECEALVAGNVHAFNIDTSAPDLSILNRLLVTSRDRIELLLVKAGSVGVEILLPELPFIRHRKSARGESWCTCIIKKVSLPSICRFFTQNHANATVRGNGEIARNAFAPARCADIVPGALGLLDPIPIEEVS